jgi:hypothetical protein
MKISLSDVTINIFSSLSPSSASTVWEKPRPAALNASVLIHRETLNTELGDIFLREFVQETPKPVTE